MSEHQEIWCQPADQPKRQFLVMFDDPQMDVAVFDSEEEARAFWEKANLNWTCYLMATLPRSAQLSATSTQVMGSLPDAVDHINRLIVALQPFVDFAQNVEYDEVHDASAWKSGIHRDAVSTWFGPSDFAYAAFAVSDTKSCIAALSAPEAEG